MNDLLLLAITCTGLVGLIVLAGCGLFLRLTNSRRRELDVLAERLSAEQRLEFATRATLRAMHDAVRQSSKG